MATGDLSVIGNSIEDWAAALLRDYEFLTGYPLLHKWQLQHGPIETGKRLMPKIPFVLGGKYELENLYPILGVSAMRTRGNLARQIENLPDGAQVEFRVIE